MRSMLFALCLLSSPPVFAQVADAPPADAAVALVAADDPAQLAARAVSAADAGDWRVLAVALLGLCGFLLRNKTPTDGRLGAFLHSKKGAILVSAVSAGIGSAVPQLQGGASLRAVLVTALASAVASLMGWLTPAPRVVRAISSVPPAAGFLLVVLMGASSIARADSLPVPRLALVEPSRAQVAADVKAQPAAALAEEAATNAVPPAAAAPCPVCPEPCAACGQRISTIGPASFWTSTGGKVIVGIFAVVGTGVSVLQSLQTAGVIGH